MIIGVPKEIKNHEYRVGLTPKSVELLVKSNHSVVVENQAGIGSGFTNDNYLSAGAKIEETARNIFNDSDLIIKVKEPQIEEISLIKKDQIIFTYLHLASSENLTKQLIDSKCISIAYETISDAANGLPLLTPMSEIAGRLSVQAGAQCLEKHSGGLGILLGGSSYSKPAETLVIGGGVVGYNASLIATGMGSNLTIVEKSKSKIEYLKNKFPKALVLNFDDIKIQDLLVSADLVIGAVLIPGTLAPKVITAKDLKIMQVGSVIVDVSIDQGGCFETSRATTHKDPTFVIDNVIHYCVANMPGAVPRTSTISLNTATIDYILQLADMGAEKFCKIDNHHLNGLNTYKGHLTYKPVADIFNMKYTDPNSII